MGYMQEVEQELRTLLDGADAYPEALVDFVKKKLLESYHNGMAAAKAGKADQRTFRDKRRPGRAA